MRELFNVNVIGNIHLFNLFLPLILKGQTKKIIVIASAWADMEWTNKYDLTPGSLYGASKAAMNLITSKYSAQYKKEGVLFLSISPGMVEVGLYDGGMIHPCPLRALDHLSNFSSFLQRHRNKPRSFQTLWPNWATIRPISLAQ